MDEHAKLVKQLEETNINAKNESDWEALKTSEEWDAWMIKNGIPEEKRDKKLASLKSDYLKYGSIYGKKYAVVTNYGDWDSEFTMEQLEIFV